MSKSVDERVVEMRFNNKQFEQGISESTKSLSNLKKSLKLEDASKGLQQVESAGKRFSLDNVATAVELVSNKFSVLGTFGDQVIRRLADGFMDLAGKALTFTKSLSIDQISAGWGKYTDKTEAVQTIMNATGKDIDYVNERLEKLQWFTDETSYNFVDMAANIGKFTNANVDLDDAVDAMMGIANWAAASGANTNEASRAMYNLSQAMSMDKLTLADWKSIELANMATMEFKQTAIDTAIEFGYLRKMADGTIQTMGGAEVTAETLRGTLDEGWFSGKVLTETLKKYSEYTNAVYDIADSYDTCAEAMEHVSGENMSLGKKAFLAAQQYKTFKDVIDATMDAVSSGWMTSFEIIFGNMEEAKELWTEVGGVFWDIFASGAEARNEILKGWKEGGGFQKIYDGVMNIYESVRRLVLYAKEGFTKIFPSITSERLISFSNAFQRMTEKFRKWSEDWRVAKSVITIFKGIGSAIQVVKKIVSAFIEPIKRVKEAFSETGATIHGAVASVFDLFTKLNESEKFQNILDKVSEKIGDILVWLVKAVRKIKEAFGDAKEFIEPYAQKVKEAFDKIKEAIKGLGKTDTSETESVFERIKRVVEPLSELFQPLIKMVKFVIAVFKKLGPVMMAAFKTVWNIIGNLFGGLTQALEGLDTGKILDMLKGGGIVAVLFQLSSALKEFKGVASGIGGTLGSIKDVAKSFKEGIGDLVGTVKKVAQVESFRTVAISIAILAASVLVLSSIEPSRLDSATAAIVALFIALFSSTGAINKNMDTKKISKVAGQMIGYSIAILILAAALKKVSSLNMDEVKNGLAAIGGLMGELILAFKVLTSNSGQTKKITKVAAGLILLAVAIRLLVKPMKELGAMDIDSIKKGLIAIGALLAELALFTKIAGGTKKMISIGLGMIELSLAMKILAGVVSTFGAMDIPTLVKGLVAVGVSITGIAAAMKLMPKGMITKSTGFVILAAGLKIIASVMKDISDLSWESIAKGLLSIGVAVVGISAAMSVFLSNKDILKATGFVIIAAGLKIIASVMKDISKLSWEDIAKGLVGISSAVVGISAAMNLMPDGMIVKALSLVVIAASLKIFASVLSDIAVFSWEDLAKGLITIGVAVVGLAGAMQLMPKGIGGAASLLIIAIALGALTPVLKDLGSMSIPDICKSLVALAGALTVVVTAAYVFSTFSKAFSTHLLKIAASAAIFAVAMEIIVRAIADLTVLGQSATDVLIATTKAFLSELPELIKLFAQAIVTAMPEIVKMISSIIAGLIQAIRENVPALVETIFSVILEVINSLVEYVGPIVDGIFKFLLKIFDALKEYVPLIAKDLALMLRGIIDAVVEAISGLSVGDVVKAIAGLTALSLVFTELLVVAALGAASTGLLILTANNLNKFIGAIDPFLQKIQQVDAQSLFGAEALANTVMTLTKASILDALTGWFRGGGDAMIKFGDQIAQLGPYIKQYADSITGIDGDAVLKSALAAQALAEFAHHIPKEGGLLQKITGETDLLGFVEALVELGPALKNYAASVDGLDAGVVENSINAASVISAFANNLPRHGGFVQAIVGDNSLNQFAQDLTVFGPNMMAYAKSVDGLKADVVIASAQAAEAISAMANGLPNQGGAVAWFAGDNTLSVFGEELAAFGPKFAEYGEAIANITPETVTASADAAAALFAVAQNVPNQGGVVSWFAGDNTLSQFAEGLVPFGEAMQKYATAVAGLGTGDITASAGAAEAMFKVAALVPNQGGVVSWFAGDNKLGDFAAGLVPFGEAMQSYAQSVAGLKVTPIVMSAKAAAAIFEVAHSIPNQGGIISWFAGDNKIGDFAEGLEPFGKALKSFGESVTDLPGDDIIAATQVMKELFVIVDMMPNQGGIKSWFVGDNKLSVFAEELEAFAPSLRKYAEELEGVTISNITASGRALKVLFESIAEMPNQGGVVSWFVGDNTLGDIGKDLEVFGPAFASFASSLDDVGADTLVKVSMAFGTLKTLGSVLNSIPDQGGFVSWFVGDNTLGAIGKDLETFGPAYAAFAKEVAAIDDLNAISVAFEGIQILANAISSMPDQGGIKSWFSGDQSLAGLAEGLPELGAALASFSTDLGTDFKVLPVMQAFGTLKYLGEALDAMPGEGGLAQWFAGETSLANIGAGLKEFGPAFADFSKQVVDLKTGPVENAFNTIKVLAESLDTMPPSGGLTQWFTGDNSLVSVGEGMKKFGPSFAKFSYQVQDLKMEPVENAFRSIRVMAEALDTMPNQGGVVSWFQGDQSLAKISEDLAKFGPKLKEYSDTVAGVKTAKVKASFQATKELALALDSMPNKGGVASWFKGDKSLGSLGDDLPNYGVSLYKFYVEISHINVDKVREGISLTESFVNIMSGMEGKRAAFIEWFTGDKSLATLGKDLAAYGGYLGDFQENVKDVKYDRLRGMVNATESIVDVVKTMEPIGGWDGFWSGEKDLSSLGYQISSLGGYFKSYVETTDGIDWDKMSTSVDVLQRFVDLGTNMQGVDFDSYYTFAESFNSLALSGTDTFISAWESGYEDIIKVGESAMSNLITGMSNKKNEVAAMASTIVTTVKNNLNGINVLHEPYNIGVNYIQGLIDGMNAKVPALDERTSWIARKRGEIMRKELGIASPSKVTHEIGEYLMEGLANGMVDGASVANNASREVSDEVLMAMTNAIASVMALMQSDGTFTPVIRPVVDLSDAEKQAGEIGGLFGKQTVAGSGFAAAAGLNRSIQNGAVLGGSNTTTTNNSAAITINVYGGHGQSAQDIANEVQKRLKQDLDRRGYAFR